MKASVRALLSGIVDYAGLFPPAKLPLEEAIRNYARYRTEPEAWMLGRFIIPAARLGELPAFAKLFAAGPPLALSLLGRGGSTVEAFLAGVRADVDDVQAFLRDQGERVAVESYEVRLSDDVGAESVAPMCSQASRLLGGAGLAQARPYFEILWTADWQEALDGMRAPIAGRRAGVKLRCGGLEASAFPSPEQLATAVTACRERGLPFKATAGLHHPLRGFRAEVQAPMHGFLNLFGAAVLSFANGLGAAEVRAILEDEEAGSFVFEDDHFRWKSYRATVPQIEDARHRFTTSFGSCSFDEPRDDLRALGLI